MSDPPQHQHPYGISQGPPSYPPPPVMVFPQQAPPPGHIVTAQPAPGYYGAWLPNRSRKNRKKLVNAAVQFTHSYNVTVEVREPLSCGIGIGWLLFILGFFLAIPWYVGAILLCASREDNREKPGYVGCTVAAVIFTILVIIGATTGANDW